MKKMLLVVFFLQCLGKMILSETTSKYPERGLTVKRHKPNWGQQGRSLDRRQVRGKNEVSTEGSEEFKEAIVFPNEMAMLKTGDTAKIGAIAYVEDGRFFGKSSRGWSPFMMGDPIKDAHGTGRTYASKAVPPTLLTKIKESKMENIDLSEDNFDKRFLRKESPVLTYGVLKLVALNNPSSGYMHGIMVANYQCQREAIQAKQNGFFRAFLTSKNLDLAEILSPKMSLHFTIVNIKGQKLFQSFESLRNHTGKWPIVDNVITPIYSFDEKNVIHDDHWPINMVWHGPARNGYITAKNSDCNEWKSSSNLTDGVAADYLTKGLFHNGKSTCDEELIVLCIETGVKLNRTDTDANISYKEYEGLLEKYEAQYARPINGGEGESSSSQSDSHYEEEHTEDADSADSYTYSESGPN